jgi:hypothetical protein
MKKCLYPAAALWLAAVSYMALSHRAVDLEAQTSLPLIQAEEFGLAARYPGDRGIERDPSVLLAEDFEQGDLSALAQRWHEVNNREGRALSFSDDSPPGSSGKRALCVTATLSENTGGHLYRMFPQGADTLYARFYVKFAPDAPYLHHFVGLGGYNPPTRWPQGHAGERPRGDDRITVGIEPWGNYGRYPPPGAWNFYCYWHEMKRSADGKYWGNSIKPEKPLLVPKGRWQCVEVMVKCNSAPDRSDGELALWLDGRKAMHVRAGSPYDNWSGMGFTVLDRGGQPFAGFRWRTSRDLKLNFFHLSHYVTENAARQNGQPQAAPVNRVWFDNVVVSTRYVGPIQR